MVKIDPLTISDDYASGYPEYDYLDISNGSPARTFYLQERSEGQGRLYVRFEMLPGHLAPNAFRRFRYTISTNGVLMTDSTHTGSLHLDTHAGTNRVFVLTAGWDVNCDEKLDASDYVSQIVSVIVSARFSDNDAIWGMKSLQTASG